MAPPTGRSPAKRRGLVHSRVQIGYFRLPIKLWNLPMMSRELPPWNRVRLRQAGRSQMFRLD